MTCETCGGARFSEEGYPHHLTEMDACECEEKPVSEEQMISCGVCGRPMERGADAHPACKRSI